MEQSPKFNFRPAGAHDEDILLKWRNDADTRAMSFSTEIVTPEQHHTWFSRSLRSPNRKLLIGLLENALVGTVRFDMFPDGSSAEISVTLAPDMRGRHLSGLLIKFSCDYYFESLGRRIPIKAEIKPGNTKSIRAFEYAGFKFVNRVEGHLEYLLQASVG